MVFLDKYNYPVERIIGKPITNIIRLILHTRKVMFGRWNGYKIV